MIEYEKKFGQVWKQLTNWNHHQVILGIMMCILAGTTLGITI